MLLYEKIVFNNILIKKTPKNKPLDAQNLHKHQKQKTQLWASTQGWGSIDYIFLFFLMPVQVLWRPCFVFLFFWCLCKFCEVHIKKLRFTSVSDPSSAWITGNYSVLCLFSFEHHPPMVARSQKKNASFGFKHLEKLWTKFFVVIPFRPSMEKATALIKALPSSKVGGCWNFHGQMYQGWMINTWEETIQTLCFFWFSESQFSKLFVLVSNTCVLLRKQEHRRIVPAWQGFTTPVFLSLLWDRWSAQGLDPIWTVAIPRCSTLLMPHVPQHLQHRFRGMIRITAGLRWKCFPKFWGDWKNITLFVGLT